MNANHCVNEIGWDRILSVRILSVRFHHFVYEMMRWNIDTVWLNDWLIHLFEHNPFSPTDTTHFHRPPTTKTHKSVHEPMSPPPLVPNPDAVDRLLEIGHRLRGATSLLHEKRPEIKGYYQVDDLAERLNVLVQHKHQEIEYRPRHALDRFVNNAYRMKHIRALSDTQPAVIRVLRDYVTKLMEFFSNEPMTVGNLQQVVAHCVV